MAEVFGDRADFAIEAGLEPGLAPPSAVWGHMCVWCRGAALGNIGDRYCALYPAYCEFGSLAAGVDRLWAEEFTGLNDPAIYDLLDGLLFGGELDAPVEPLSRLFGEEYQGDGRDWGRFSFLTNWGEQFDGYQAFIVCPPGGPARILSRAFIGFEGCSVAVTPAAIVAAADGFRRWFEEQELRLRQADAEPAVAEDGEIGAAADGGA